MKKSNLTTKFISSIVLTTFLSQFYLINNVLADLPNLPNQQSQQQQTGYTPQQTQNNQTTAQNQIDQQNAITAAVQQNPASSSPNQQEVTLPDGTRQTQDAQGRIIRQVSSDASQTTLDFTYDANGSIQKIVKTYGNPPANGPTETIFDFQTMKASEKHGDGIERIFSFTQQSGSLSQPIAIPAGQTGLASWVTNPTLGSYKILVGTLTGAAFNVDSARLNGNAYDNTEAPFSERIYFNPLLEQGDIFNAQGLRAGSFRFHTFTDNLGTARSILRVTYEPTAIYFNRAESLFLVDAERNEFFYLASYLYSGSSERRIDFSDGYFNRLAKFVDNPLSLTADEYHQLNNLSSNSQNVQNDYQFRTTFTPVFFHKLLDALAKNPGFQFADGIEPIVGTRTGVYNQWLDSIQKQRITEHLEHVWDNLSLSVKDQFLSTLNTGNGVTMNLLGRLLVRFLDELSVTQPTAQSLLGKLSGLSCIRAAVNIIKNIDVEPAIRSSVAHGVIALYIQSGAVSSDLFDFLRTMILQNDGIVLNAADYTADISELIDIVFAQPTPPTDQLEILLDHFYAYIDPSHTTALEAIIDGALASYDGSASRAKFLLAAFNSPAVGIQKKNQIENQLMASTSDFGGWFFHYNLDLLFALGGYVDSRSMNFSSQNQARIFREIASAFIANFSNRTGNYDYNLMAFIMTAKRSNNFTTNAQYFLPILELLNPQISGETDSQYSARLARINDLWTNHKIFLRDPSGATYLKQGYLDVVSDFAQSRPNWIDVLIFRENGGFDGFMWPHTLDIGWGALSDHNLMYLLSHEAGHNFHLSNLFGITAELDLLTHYWYYQPNTHSPEHYISGYAGNNTVEDVAEIAAFWYWEGPHWLNDALGRYKNGAPSVLNTIMWFWINTAVNEATPDDTLPVYHSNPTTGRLESEYLSARWLSGNMSHGRFQFILDNTTYLLNYQNYKIGSVITQALRPDNTVITTEYNFNGIKIKETIGQVILEVRVLDDGKILKIEYAPDSKKTLEKTYAGQANLDADRPSQIIYFDENENVGRIERRIYANNGSGTLRIKTVLDAQNQIIEQIFYYSNSAQPQIENSFLPDGTAIFIGYTADGKKVTETLYPDRAAAETNPPRPSSVTSFNANGAPESVERYIYVGSPPVLRQKTVFNIVNGQEVMGALFFYYPNGQVMVEMKALGNGQILKTEYAPDGKKTTEKTYSNQANSDADRPSRIATFDASGILSLTENRIYTNGFLRQRTVLNAQNEVIEQEIFYSNSNQVQIRTQFQVSGTVLTVNYAFDSKKVSETIYSNPAAAEANPPRPSSVTFFNANGMRERVERYVYAGNPAVLRQKTLLKLINSQETIDAIFFYYPNGQAMVEMKTIENGKILRTEYTSDGKKTFEKTYANQANADTDKPARIIIFDANGNLFRTENRIYDATSGFLGQRTVLNSQNQIIEQQIYYSGSTQVQIETKLQPAGTVLSNNFTSTGKKISETLYPNLSAAQANRPSRITTFNTTGTITQIKIFTYSADQTVESVYPSPSDLQNNRPNQRIITYSDGLIATTALTYRNNGVLREAKTVYSDGETRVQQYNQSGIITDDVTRYASGRTKREIEYRSDGSVRSAVIYSDERNRRILIEISVRLNQNPQVTIRERQANGQYVTRTDTLANIVARYFR